MKFQSKYLVSGCTTHFGHKSKNEDDLSTLENPIDFENSDVKLKFLDSMANAYFEDEDSLFSDEYSNSMHFNNANDLILDQVESLLKDQKSKNHHENIETVDINHRIKNQMNNSEFFF